MPAITHNETGRYLMFHDVVLKDGAVPLDILEENVDAWITETKAAE